MFAELWARTNASFLAGASHAEEMVESARSLGYAALAITDVDEVGGVVRAHAAAKKARQPLIVGAEISLSDFTPIHPRFWGERGRAGTGSAVVLAKNRAGWAQLCRWLTTARTTSPRGEPSLSVSALLSMPGDVFVLFTRPPSPELARRAVQALGDDAGLLVSRSYGPGEAAAIDAARALSEATGLGLVASGAARYHCRSRKPLMDTLTAIRLGVPVDKAGYALEAHAERCLMSPRELAHRFHTVGLGGAVDRGLAISEQCTLNLDELRFVYPEKHLPAGTTPIAHFVDVVLAGARARYGDPLPPGAERQLRHELGVVERMRVEGFFLTMHDIVGFARQQGILCQGRGSAANSAICYALGITSVDPVSAGLLFERFISEERGEPPDIDVDFEHERREEVIQFVYDFYGRDHTALVCENICYRMRSAVRDVGKAVGLSLDQVDRLAKSMSFWTPERGDETLASLGEGHGSPDSDDGPDDPRQLDATHLRDAGIDPASRVAGLLRAIVPQLLGFPRHRGTHVGGMVVTHEPLIDTAPLEPAAMPNRAILPWDKDDCDILGMCKFDLLALGILSALRKAFVLVEQHHGVAHALNTIPQGDSLTYERIRAADTLGTFQIESRAQMATLPRLRPERFYDIVVAISIIRPGPIQGGMVHPYLRRRNGEEPISFPHPSLVPILARTLGVPLFQEQVMRIAVDAAGFTPGESDELRRKMGAWRKRGTMGDVRDRLVRGMAERGIGEVYAEQIFSQIKGFGEYGFPESHAISFALLAYASAFLKTHFPAAFACALLNSQPMGFYSPHTIVEDARRHGVIVLPIDVEHSDWDCTLEQGALRVGVRYVAGLGSAAEARFTRAVARRPFRSIDTFAAASAYDAGALGRLAHAGAFRSLDRIDWRGPEGAGPLESAGPRPGWGLAAGETPGDDRACRRAAFWQVLRLHEPGTLPLGDDPIASFPRMSPAEEVRADYETAGLSPLAHPVSFIRPMLARRGALDIRSLERLGGVGEAASRTGVPADGGARPPRVGAADGRKVFVGGLIVGRQHPGTARGFVFLSLEDETGLLNVIISPDLFAAQRTEITQYPFVVVEGVLQCRDLTVSLKAARVHPLWVDGPEASGGSKTEHAAALLAAPPSRDFR